MNALRHVAPVLCCLAIVWLAADGERLDRLYSFSGPKTDYYNLLSHGLAKGHLWMDTPADPRLRDDPEKAILAGVPYLLDASLHEGRYYLYFGVGPVLLTFLPYRVLSGNDLSPNAVTAAFVVGALAFQLATFHAARRRYFPGIGLLQEAGIAGLMAFGAATPFLLLASGPYELAIASGYAAMSAGWWALWHAWHSDRRGLASLALASIAIATAVACRPVYLLALPAVLWIALRTGVASGRARAWRIGAAILPAAAIGVGLMAYNYLRFGNPAEFGFKYQLSALMFAGMPWSKAAFIWPNLQWYYFSLPGISSFFPFVLPVDAALRPTEYYGFEAIHGQAVVLLASVIAATGLMLLRRRNPELHNLIRWLLVPGTVFVALLLFLCTFGFRADRYVADFQGTLVIALAITGGAVAAHAGRLVRGTILGLGVACAAHNIFAGLNLSMMLATPSPPRLAGVEYAGNHLSHFLEQVGLVRYGPLAFASTLRPGQPSEWRSLARTGSRGLTDELEVQQDAAGRTRFRFAHEKHGSLATPEIALAPGSRHDFRISMGSLYPPRNHPYYRGMSREEVENLRTIARVAVDGSEVFRSRLPFYERTSDKLALGTDPGSPVRRGDDRGIADALAAEPGIWRVEFEVPSEPGVPFPILGSGFSSFGNMLRVRRISDSQLQFSLDRWGGGEVVGPMLRAAPGSVHTVDIVAGPRAARLKPPEVPARDSESLAENADSLRVWYDGIFAWESRPLLHPGSFTSVGIGANAQGFSDTPMFYRGRIRAVPLSAEDVRRIAHRARLQASGEPGEREGWDGFPGPLRITLTWPDHPAGAREPLLATGRTGAGDLIYARWTGPGRIVIGIDHWGVGAIESDSVEIDPRRPSTVEVSTGGVLPPLDAALYRSHPEMLPLRRAVAVRMDGRDILTAPVESYPAAADSIEIARNSIGSSSAGPRFTGQIVAIEHGLPAAALAQVRKTTLGAPAHPDPAMQGYPGAIAIVARIRPQPPGSREILASTGVPGAGDVFFIQHEPDGGFRIGWDHWGSPLTLSNVMHPTREGTFELQLSADSLYPSGDTGRTRPTIALVDGREIFRSDVAAFKSSAEAITVGAGFIGGSIATAPFSGRIVEVRNVQ